MSKAEQALKEICNVIKKNDLKKMGNTAFKQKLAKKLHATIKEIK